MKIDLGGIAKGYTSSRIMDIYKDNGITSGLVNLGGNVQALGTKTDGTKWKIAVQSPDDTEDYLGILSVQDKAVITSGGYERYFEQDGVTYHHIIDPKTGYPAESGLVSVSYTHLDVYKRQTAVCRLYGRVKNRFSGNLVSMTSLLKSISYILLLFQNITL